MFVLVFSRCNSGAPWRRIIHRNPGSPTQWKSAWTTTAPCVPWTGGSKRRKLMENQETGHQSSSSTWSKLEETFPTQWFNRNRRTHMELSRPRVRTRPPTAINPARTSERLFLFFSIHMTKKEQRSQEKHMAHTAQKLRLLKCGGTLATRPASPKMLNSQNPDRPVSPLLPVQAVL